VANGGGVAAVQAARGNARAAVSGAVVQGGERAADGAEGVQVAVDGGRRRRTTARWRE
jgi:hypothetical protein